MSFEDRRRELLSLRASQETLGCEVEEERIEVVELIESHALCRGNELQAEGEEHLQVINPLPTIRNS